MRLTADRAKQAILHPEQHVRNAAVHYFASSYSEDRDVLPLVIQAIEQYGDQDAFRAYSFLENLSHTDDTLRWVADDLRTVQRPPLDDDFYGSFARGLILSFVHADPAVLQPYQDLIDQLDCLADADRLMVTERIRMTSAEPDVLWEDLEQFCEQHKSDHDMSRADLDHVHRLVEALARHGELFVDRVLELLSLDIQDFDSNPLVWLEMFAARMAGEMRLESAVPLLVDKLNEEGDWLIEECLWTLIKIGTDAVVTGLWDDYIATGWEFRFSAAGILQDIHSDQAVTTCFDLLNIERDPELRNHLYRVLLLNAATEAFEPVRQLLLETSDDRDPDWLELRSDLVTAATIMEVDLPELDEWKEDMRHDVEFRKQWYAEQHGWLKAFHADDDFDDEYPEDGDLETDDDWSRPSGTVIAKRKTGRNDPCPCGSGKKFKKCCLNAQR